MVNITRIEVVNYHDNICQVLENLFFLKLFHHPFKKKVLKITLTEVFFDNILMTGIVNKIVNNFDN